MRPRPRVLALAVLAIIASLTAVAAYSFYTAPTCARLAVSGAGTCARAGAGGLPHGAVDAALEIGRAGARLGSRLGVMISMAPDAIQKEVGIGPGSDSGAIVTHLHRFAVKGLERDEMPSVTLAPGATMPHDREWAMLWADGKAEQFDSARPAWLHKGNFLCAFTANELLGSLTTSFDDATRALSVRRRSDGKTLLPSARLDDEARPRRPRLLRTARTTSRLSSHGPERGAGRAGGGRGAVLAARGARGAGRVGGGADTNSGTPARGSQRPGTLAPCTSSTPTRSRRPSPPARIQAARSVAGRLRSRRCRLRRGCRCTQSVSARTWCSQARCRRGPSSAG